MKRMPTYAHIKTEVSIKKTLHLELATTFMNLLK